MKAINIQTTLYQNNGSLNSHKKLQFSIWLETITTSKIVNKWHKKAKIQNRYDDNF